MDSPVFNRALALTLRFEGGFVSHPHDGGGATNYGITQATYDRYRERELLGTRPVSAIARSEVVEIYENIWFAAACNLLLPRMAICHFDAAVNHGVTQANKFWLYAIAARKPTTVIGVGTYAIADEETEIRRYLKRRAWFYGYLVFKRPANLVFLRGWVRRLRELKRYLRELKACEFKSPTSASGTGSVEI